MLKLRYPALLLVAVAGSVSASYQSTNDRTTTLDVVSKTIAPDGYPRLATLANGTFPGPIISANKGDEFSINVFDRLNEKSLQLDLSTSIHWHGIFQHHTNYVDGPACVTQCPLVPEESFLYRFNGLSQAGTFWYHSHFKARYCDGLRGPLVIYDPNDPQGYLYDVDNDDTVITLADWYHFLSTEASGIPALNSTLINGKGRYPGGPSDVALATVNVCKGKRYRFRLVSISCEPNFFFSIDGHQMTVIEVDGNNVQPLLIDEVQIFAGQRYSVVVNANQPIANYWIRALPESALGTANFSDFNNVAVLHYEQASNDDPPGDPSVNVPVSKLPLVETNLHPLTPSRVPGKPMPGGADININLEVTPSPTAYLVNGVSFDAPIVPVLLQILSDKKHASDLLPAGSIYGVKPNMSVELTISGGAVGGPHPVHLHGHAFSVVRSAGNLSYNFDNPVIRDVVSMGNMGDNVTIRFFTDNPGAWFFHCHIDWHLAAGFAEDVPDVSQQDFVCQMPGKSFARNTRSLRTKPRTANCTLDCPNNFMVTVNKYHHPSVSFVFM